MLAKTIVIFKKLLHGIREVKAWHSEMIEFNLKKVKNIFYGMHMYY